MLELDLTSRRLVAANEQLSWANEALGAFAGQVSHDLKNPLAAVIMSLGLALEDVEDEHPSRELIERAGRSASRMSTMIGDLLDFAAGRVGATRESVDLAALVAVVREDLGASPVGAVSAGRRPAGRPRRPGPLRVVVQNLVANAAKFARPDVPVGIEVSGYLTDRFWRLEVADNGRGVPLEERTRVLEPMVRLDKRVPGSGIGLATCARIVAAHGGSIGVTDGLGEGLPDGEVGTDRLAGDPGRLRASATTGQSWWDRPGRSSIRWSAIPAQRSVSGSTSITLTTGRRPATPAPTRSGAGRSGSSSSSSRRSCRGRRCACPGGRRRAA